MAASSGAVTWVERFMTGVVRRVSVALLDWKDIQNRSSQCCLRLSMKEMRESRMTAMGLRMVFKGNVSSLMFLRESRPGSLDDRNRGEV